MPRRCARNLAGRLVARCFASAARFPAIVIRAEPLPLPAGQEAGAPWQKVLTPAEGTSTPEDAARFRMADDPAVGRVLVVGPWVAGTWSARARYQHAYPATWRSRCG